MCGIAGYSFGTESRVDRTLAAQALLAGIAERGADAVGYAFRADGRVTIHKQQTGASALLEAVAVSPAACQALVHVRDYTKGHPTISANNHPIRHGSVVGIHNGIIANDEELLRQHGLERHEAEMTVDSEAIFALVHAHGSRPEVLDELVGAIAAAWIDERDADVLNVARGVGRPLWLARGRHEALFASTRDALEVVERALETTFRKTQVEEGRLLMLRDGELVKEHRWSPDRSYREEQQLPAVRAPHEGRSCLDRLWAIAAPAST
jgi:glucosamine 6-phosphate synthetase-like amidotransferase/phosphosugar isomerase protein